MVRAMHVVPDQIAKFCHVEIRSKQERIIFNPEASPETVFAEELQLKLKQLLLFLVVVRARKLSRTHVSRVVINNLANQGGAIFHVLLGRHQVGVPKDVDQLAGHALFVPRLDGRAAAAGCRRRSPFAVRLLLARGDFLGDQGLDALDDEKAAVLISHERSKATVGSNNTIPKTTTAKTVHHQAERLAAAPDFLDLLGETVVNGFEIQLVHPSLEGGKIRGKKELSTANLIVDELAVNTVPRLGDQRENTDAVAERKDNLAVPGVATFDHRFLGLGHTEQESENLLGQIFPKYRLEGILGRWRQSRIRIGP